MISTRKIIESKRKLFSRLDDFAQDIVIGNAARERQELTIVNECNGDLDLTVSNSDNIVIVNENTRNVKTSESYNKERIDRETTNFVNTFGDRIQIAILDWYW